MKERKLPRGWNEDRVREVLAHYEAQSEEDAVAEDEAAAEDPTQTHMGVPTDLMPTVPELISRKAS